VALEIAWSVAFDVQIADLSWAGYGSFSHRGADGFATPENISGETDVQGD
jgi:hypothetical protein